MSEGSKNIKIDLEYNYSFPSFILNTTNVITLNIVDCSRPNGLSFAYMVYWLDTKVHLLRMTSYRESLLSFRSYRKVRVLTAEEETIYKIALLPVHLILDLVDSIGAFSIDAFFHWCQNCLWPVIHSSIPYPCIYNPTLD